MRTRMLVLAWALAGCHGAYPEGRYPCETATASVDCPPGWFCHAADDRCYSTAEQVLIDAAANDASTQDGFSPDRWSPEDAAIDVGSDAAIPDGGCVSSTETCDGLDNDCDDLVDEGLARVGAPVSVGSGSGNTFVRIVSRPSGFGLQFHAYDLSSARETYWSPIDATGTPTRTPTSLGGDALYDRVAMRVDGSEAVAIGESNFYLSATHSWSYSNYSVLTFDSATGSRRLPASGPPFTIAGSNPRVASQVTDFGSGHATVFTEFGSAPPLTVRRYRVVTSSSLAVGASLDVGTATAWDALTVGDQDVVFRVTSGGLLLSTVPRGDAGTSYATIGPLPGLPTDPTQIAAVVAREEAAPSAGNPIGVALARPSPNGIVFLQLSSTSIGGIGTPVNLPGSIGGGAVTVVAAEPSPHAGHFYVAAMDTSAAGATTGSLRVWELTGEPPQARPIVVVDDWTAARFQVSSAASGDTVRLAETDDVGNVVTRSIGCR